MIPETDAPPLTAEDDPAPAGAARADGAPPLADPRFLIADQDSVVLVGVDGKKLLVRVEAGKGRGTHHGEINLDALIGQPIGATILSRKGQPFYVLRPTLEDFVMGVKRATQIVYPKDLGPILVKLGLFPGARVIECGSGSGALTTALAWMVRPGGQVFSYDRQETHQSRARQNIERAGLGDMVTFKSADVGPVDFDEGPADAVFLDVKDVPDLLPAATRALHPGCMLGALVPTMNQVSDVLACLAEGPWVDVDVLETFHRRYKLNPARMRPFDRMIGHTSYLIFARRVTSPPPRPPTGEDRPVDGERDDPEDL